jgi:hypothetical protein
VGTSLNGSFLVREYDVASNLRRDFVVHSSARLTVLSVLRSANASGYYDCRGVRMLWQRGHKVNDHGCEPQSGAGQLASDGTLSTPLEGWYTPAVPRARSSPRRLHPGLTLELYIGGNLGFRMPSTTGLFCLLACRPVVSDQHPMTVSV